MRGNRLIPQYIGADDPEWVSVAERLIELYRAAQGCTRGELEEEVAEAVGDSPTQLVHQGLAKLLEDRCEFDVESSDPARRTAREGLPGGRGPAGGGRIQSPGSAGGDGGGAWLDGRRADR